MTAQETVGLNDTRVFQTASGLWTGKKGPLVRVKVLRSTDFCGDGRFDYKDVTAVDVEERQLTERRLVHGDIVVERSGGGPNQPVGRVAIFEPDTLDSYCCGNFTTSIRVVAPERFDPAFVAFYLHYWHMIGETQRLQNATTGIRNLDWSKYIETEIPQPELSVQHQITRILKFARAAYTGEDQLLDLLRLAKSEAMRELFTRGLRGEAQKESEVGSIPESWKVKPIDEHFVLHSGGTPSRSMPAYWESGSIPWVKTGEVNYSLVADTEERITALGLENSAAKLLPAGTLLIAMYGQGVTRGRVAILGIDAACNQACAAFRPKDNAIKVKFLYFQLAHAYERLRSLSHGGQQQNLNMDIVGQFPIPFPDDLTEQQEIIDVLESLDAKIETHRNKKKLLERLFESLLHKLMTGEIRVSDLDLSALDAVKANEVSA